MDSTEPCLWTTFHFERVQSGRVQWTPADSSRPISKLLFTLGEFSLAESGGLQKTHLWATFHSRRVQSGRVQQSPADSSRPISRLLFNIGESSLAESGGLQRTPEDTSLDYFLLWESPVRQSPVDSSRPPCDNMGVQMSPLESVTTSDD